MCLCFFSKPKIADSDHISPRNVQGLIEKPLFVVPTVEWLIEICVQNMFMELVIPFVNQNLELVSVLNGSPASTCRHMCCS